MELSLFQRGLTNIDNGLFVRAHLLPVAIAHEKWNIVVSEAHRAAELVLRGMIFLSGRAPDEDHNLSRHVRVLEERLLNGGEVSLPFYAGVYANNGDALGVQIWRGSIVLMKRIHDTYTILGSMGATDTDIDLLGVRLETNGPLISVETDQGSYLRTLDASLTGPLTRIIKRISIEPSKERIERVRSLRRIGQRLYKNRNPALYGEEQFEKEDGEIAILDMEAALEALNGLLLIEQASTGAHP